jgi:DNA-binding response OmpR family regulator
VLLDVRMPEMDGFEVCRRLKAIRAPPASRDLHDAVDDTLQGRRFSAGRVDYITKPIQREELLARIQNHLQLHRLQKELVSEPDLALKNASWRLMVTPSRTAEDPLAAANRFRKFCTVQADNLSGRAEAFGAAGQRCAPAMTGEVVDALLLSTVAQQA